MLKMELRLLDRRDTGDNTDEIDREEANELVSRAVKGKYEDVLKHSLAEKLLGCASQQTEYQDLDGIIQSCASRLVDENGAGAERQVAILTVGVGCLQLFVQNNWLGPPTETDPINFVPNMYRTEGMQKRLQDHVSSSLSVDGQDVYSLAKYPLYLYLARAILLDCRQVLQQCQTADWWLMRCLQVHQALLEERSPTLKATVMDLIENISRKEPLMTDDKNRDLLMQFHLEAGHLCYFYYCATQAKEHFAQARKLSGLSIELTGVMGKRTRFQESDIPQLVLQVQREDANPSQATQDNEQAECLPKRSCVATWGAARILRGRRADSWIEHGFMIQNVALQDDTVLNKIMFTDSTEHLVSSLSAVDEALIISMCQQHRKIHEGQGDIIKEESLAYINCVLAQPRDWSVQSMALCLRSQWEADNSRRMERSLMQMEELVNQHKYPQPDAASRLALFYSIKMPPRWILERDLGNFLIKIGALNAALEVFLRIQLWEDVIKCYHALGRTEKAEKVIREQLAIKETPDLYCYLGDVTREEQHYIKAWEMSNSRCSRAQRSLGYLYLNRGEFEKCLTCFEKSLEVNKLQVGVWFSYGCAAIAVDKYDVAARGFHHCVTLEPENFEAWNNLATAYIRSNQKPRALLVLQEALKCEYENWKIWENYLLVAIDCGEFLTAIKAYHRLIDLKDKYTDAEVLGILVRAVTQSIEDAAGNSAAALKGKLQELFGRLTSKVTGNADVWRLYAQLLLSDEASTEERARALQYLQKSHRCLSQTPNWERDVTKCRETAQQSTHLARVYLSCSEKVAETAQALQLLSSAKLMLKGILTRIQQKHTDPVTKQLPGDLNEPCQNLDTELQKIMDKITQLKGT